MTELTTNAEQKYEEYLKPVVEKLGEFTLEDVTAKLEGVEVDPEVGIAHAVLDGEIETPKGNYRMHVARIFPTKHVRGHFHEDGLEPYIILSGSGGEMNTGRLIDNKVKWNPARNVNEGELIVIEEEEIHCLNNTDTVETEQQPYIFVFACPDSHLTDPPSEGADRHFVEGVDGIENGTPPHLKTN